MLKKWSLDEQGYDYIYKELQHGSTLARLIGSPVARATTATADGIFSNVGGNFASYYAQKKALEAK